MLFLSICNNLGHCPVTLPRMRRRAKLFPCQQFLKAHITLQASAGWRRTDLGEGGLCSESCRDSTAIAPPSEALSSHWRAGNCVLPYAWCKDAASFQQQADKGHSEKSPLTLQPLPPQTKEKAFAGGGDTHLPPRRYPSGFESKEWGQTGN